MLFLAVFCGFLAEYQLEHKIEKDREKQFMLSFLQDLKADTGFVNELNPFRLETEDFSSMLASILSSKTYLKDGFSVYKIVRYTSRRRFFYSADGTLQQLKYSGGLRLVGNQQVADSIKSYDVFYRNILQLQELEQTQLQHYRELVSKLFDANIVKETIANDERLNDSIRSINPQLLQNDPVLLNELVYMIGFKRANSLQIYHDLEILRKKAENLIELIKVNYKFN
jgi:hypothetical protein